MIKVTKQLKDWCVKQLGMPSTITDESIYRARVAEALADGTLSHDDFLELSKEMSGTKSPDPEKVFGGNNGGNSNIRIKAPSESYDETRYAAKSTKTGMPVVDPILGQEVSTISQAAKARHGVLFKHLGNKSGLVHNPLSEHERNLLDEMSTENSWCGKISGEYFDKVTGHHNVKALVDDATSGGLEITPIEFDADIISFPLLHGELFPQVDLKSVPRGRRIEGASISTPTMSWGGADDSAIDLFSTNDMVAAIDTTIFAIDGAVEVGRDFLSDSPVEVGNVLTSLVGERLMNELDKVIANGNGMTQPEGLFQKSGVSTVSPDNTSSGPPTLDDYYDLLFGVGKQYRKSAFRPCFVSNDTSYRRSRSIKIDSASPSTDQRSALAPMMDSSFFENYSTLGWPHKVENNLGNAVAGFFCLGKFRLYRRLGLEMRFVHEGSELARRNMMLLVYRARYGGQLMDASAAAKWTNGQS